MMLNLPIGDGMQTDVSFTAQHAIETMKAKLESLAVAYMACAPVGVAPRTMEKDLASLVPSKWRDSKDESHYGYEIDFRAQRRGSVVGLVADTAIECGSDASLFVFMRAGSSWREALRWRSKPYSSIKDALWAFDYAISPTDTAGRWFVAAKSLAPWCSSTWSEVRLVILRPQEATQEPKVLLARSDSIWYGGDDIGRLSVTVRDVDLRFQSQSIESAMVSRLAIRHYRIDGDVVRRVPPLANSPLNFVDEWIVSPWAEASEWTAVEARAGLAREHDRLTKNATSAGYSIASEATLSDGSYEIVLLNEDKACEYFLVMGPEDFVMKDAGRRPPKACARQSHY